MEIKLLTTNEIQKAAQLYQDIKNKSYTPWNKDYPSLELIEWDIERNGLYGVFENEKLIAICFAGERCEDSEEGFSWKENFEKRATFARLGVSPEYQNIGVATFLLNFIFKKLELQGFDGVRILVGTQNLKAKKLYSKFGFKNCGTIKRINHEFDLLELRLK